jgi:hypothetical protein
MNKVIFELTRYKLGDRTNYNEKFNLEELELIYDALNEFPQWNDDEDDNPTSRIMNKLYNMIEV